MDDNSRNKEGYQSPPASSIDQSPWGPFNKRKIPLDDYHICPCCDGKGFVAVVNEKDVKDVPPRPKNVINGYPYVNPDEGV